jgi:photosystem II stability/assembly factor-like uncharacterized protein
MQVIRLALVIAVSAVAAAQSPAPTAIQAQPLSPLPARQVWQMQESGTTAGLRGIDSVDGTVAWASGTGGTVLRTTDGGAHWQKCATPDGAKDGATLDFRGVQAWDASTAMVMASGKGRLSRLYKTRDACKTWKLVFKNPDKDGFWDALYFGRFEDRKGRWDSGWLLGDPVKGMFSLFYTYDAGKDWFRQSNKGLRARTGAQGAFAASNSSLIALGGVVFGSGGADGAFVYSGVQTEICLDDCSPEESGLYGNKHKWNRQPVSVGQNTDSSGVFSIDARPETPIALGYPPRYEVFEIVGGDYSKPDESTGTAAWSADGGLHWAASTTPPHGFRSAVQWSETLKLWITVGTNGSDVSRDDGKTWQPLDDGNWNALSLPFVVGPNGRIARLNPQSLASASVQP